MRVSWIVSVVLIGSSLVSGTLAAQSPADRARIVALRDSLDAIDDSTVLLARERIGIDSAKVDRHNAMRHIGLGFLAYRIGQVTGNKQHFDDAAGEFEWATELQPDWPYAWYGLGLADLALGESGSIAVENIRQALGLDNLSQAAAAFSRAAQADPSFAQAVVDLGETALRQRVRPQLAVALGALRQASLAPAGIANPTIQLLRGRIEREAGSPDSALVAFDRYLAAGGDSGIGMLERARTLFALGDEANGRDAYYTGAAHLTSDSARALYRSDISWVADSTELARFDSLPDSAVTPWLHRFWARRDAADLRRPGARLAEHYRRYFYVLHHYRLTSPHRHYGAVEQFRSSQHLVDDRGVVYMREGEPDARERYNAIGIDPNVTWLYRRPGGNLLLTFVAIGGVQDYKLVGSLADVFGMRGALALQAGDTAAFRRALRLPPDESPSRIASDLFSSRASLDPLYRRLSTATGVGLGNALAAERDVGQRSAAIATTTDGYPLEFPGGLDPIVRAYVVSGSGGATLLVVFAVPGTRLTPQAVDGRTVYPLEVRAAATPATGLPTTLDTLRLFATPSPLTGDQDLTGYVELPVSPGPQQAGVVLIDRTSGAGSVVRLDSVNVPPFGADSLTVSDVVLGDPHSTLRWRAGADTIPLSALGRYASADSLMLYYEIHGLPVGRAYRTKIAIKKQGGGSIFAKIGRLFGGGRNGVSLRYDGISQGPAMRRQEVVGLGGLGGGTYTITLDVEDLASHVHVERSARFDIR